MAMGNEQQTAFNAHQDGMKMRLRSHFVPKTRRFVSQIQSGTVEVKTMGKHIFVTKGLFGMVTVESNQQVATVVRPDIAAKDGVIHVIDGFLGTDHSHFYAEGNETSGIGRAGN